MKEILGVTGGPAGIAALWDEVQRLATELDATGERVQTHVGSTAAALADPVLLETVLLSPATGAAAEGALVLALGAVTAVRAELEASSAGVRTAVAALEQADDSARDLVRGLDAALMSSPAGPAFLAAALVRPGLLQHAVNGLGGPRGASVLSRLYGEPPVPRVRRWPGGTRSLPPRSVRDLVEHLGTVAALSPDPDSPGNGTIEVQTLRSPDGPVRHVVYLPGTDRFDAPWQDGELRGMGTNLDLMSGRPDPYTAGIREAMALAGVRPGEPVLLVGHSQGGMAAAALVAGGAAAAAVTAGSPTAQVPSYPPGTHVLSLEQRGDVVPLLDGEPNPDSVEQTTVVFDAEPPDGVLAHHDYTAYADGAELVDASDDPVVQAGVEPLEPWLGAVDSTSQQFQIDAVR